MLSSSWVLPSLWIFLSDFKENVDNKTGTPIHFENELAQNVAIVKSLLLNSCRNRLYASLCILKKKIYSANAESAIGFCGEEVSTQMLPSSVMVMMI